jgi:hypothetical protein
LGLPFSVVIRHSKYCDSPLQLDQLPFVYIQIPHDASVKSLCLEFFEAIDRALGYTDYKREAKRAGGIAEMVILIVRVATAVSLGVLFIDELQNLRVARGPNIVIVLNLFSRLVELAGVSVYTSGTPSLRTIFTAGTANQRKLFLAGEIGFPLMEEDSPELNDFMETLWDYQYVRNRGELTPSVRRAWFDGGAGNPAFMVLVFALAQRNEIGGREVVDELSLQMAAKRHMATLQPAVAAMRIGDDTALDGMNVRNELSDLREQLGMPNLDVGAYRAETDEEFGGVESSGTEPARKRRGTPKGPVRKDLPQSEDPLNMR